METGEENENYICMRSNKVALVVILCAITLVSATLFCFQIYFQSHDKKPSNIELSSTAPPLNYRGPLDDCLHYDILYSKNGDVAADCTDNYVHFYPKNYDPQVATKTKGTLRVGSFNLFHLGDNQSSMKNLRLVAKIMNQWDVVGAQEMMPLPNEWASANQKIFEFVMANKDSMNFPHPNWQVTMPGYLRLLDDLQTLDSSWALILQPRPEGEGSSGEMAGFYYRSSRVRLKDWAYCPVDHAVDLKTNSSLYNYGCLAQVSDEQRKLMSRVGFTANFQAGNFDFVGITTHIRFRPADLEEDRKAQAASLCDGHENPAKCKVPIEFVGRFYEVEAIVGQIRGIREIADDQDVIFMGDFNIEYNGKNNALWNAALKEAPGYVVTQTDPTSVGIQAAKMVSNYDHFILDPKATKECDVKSVRAFNFTEADDSTDPVMKEIAHFLNPKMQELLLGDAEQYIATLMKYQNGKGNNSLRPLNDKEKKDMMKSYTDSVARMKTNKYGAVLELISDHIPIEMDCRIGSRDDD